MEIENSLLRIQLSRLSKENAFLKIKMNMLEQRKTPSEVTIINKQLYLEYIEEVLNHKEKQLIDIQKKQEETSYRLINQQSHINFLNPLENSTQIDIFIKKLQEIKALALNDFNTHGSSSFQISQWKHFMKRQAQIIDQCRNYQRQTQNLIKNQYQNLVRQRKQLSQSMDKFQELHSYEKYLNELQKILEVKENEMLKKEEELMRYHQQAQVFETQRGGLSFGRENRSVKTMSEKKRLKIFQSANKSQNAKFFNQYDSGSDFSSNPSNPHFSQPSQSNNIPIVNQSSFIMQQQDNNQIDTSKSYFAPPEVKEQSEEEQKQMIQYVCVQTQTNIETINESIERLEKEKKILRFARLWLKFSIHNWKKPSNGIKKTFGLYLWRLNAVHDQTIPGQLLTLDWPKKYEATLRQQQLFPYNELSLNRKRYAELTLDLQKKNLHKKKIQNTLKYIILKKNIKERLVFVCYFKRYLQNARTKTIMQYENAIEGKNKFSGKNTTVVQNNSRYNTDSNLISANSSRIMNENYPLHEKNRDSSRDGRGKTKSYLSSKSMSTTQFLNSTQQRSIKTKQHVSPGDSLDAKKLKQFIKTHQQAQKALATQCIKTQSLCKLSRTLICCFNRQLIYGFYQIKKFQEKQRIIELEKKIGKYEFKWELFMTKCKLAIVNNNNKIGHLEDTLAFMMGK